MLKQDFATAIRSSKSVVDVLANSMTLWATEDPGTVGKDFFHFPSCHLVLGLQLGGNILQPNEVFMPRHKIELHTPSRQFLEFTGTYP